LHFAPGEFAKWEPESRAMTRYAASFEAARGDLEPAIAEVAAVVCFASYRNPDGMRFHLARAFEKGARREQIAEGLSYVLLHRGGPTMIDAVGCWEKAAADLKIPGPY
jgi:alkylhydroperoxidase/carboxymuconolactone decarboxylase family protein YurZ